MFILLMTSLMNSYIPMIALEWLKFHISQLSYHRANKGRQPSTMLLLALPLAAAAVSASYSPSASEAFVDSIAESFSATDGDNDVGVFLPLPDDDGQHLDRRDRRRLSTWMGQAWKANKICTHTYQGTVFRLRSLTQAECNAIPSSARTWCATSSPYVPWANPGQKCVAYGDAGANTWCPASTYSCREDVWTDGKTAWWYERLPPLPAPPTAPPSPPSLPPQPSPPPPLPRRRRTLASSTLYK